LIVGGCDLPNSPTDSSRAVVWRGDTLTELDSLCGDRADARDVNNSGQIVGWSSAGEHSEGQAMLWTGQHSDRFEQSS